MLFRTMLHVFLSRFQKRLGYFDVARSRFRVMPTDLDIFRHMNNGVYLSIFDVGRFDLLRRARLWNMFIDRGWYPVVASETITFRKSLTLWQRFIVESRIIGYDEKAVFLEHRAVVDGEIFAQAFIRARFTKRTGGTVSIAEIMELVGTPPSDLRVPEWLTRWGADVSLPPSRATAPSLWE
jgi:acyl-CoA thioesterase FadM